MLKRRTRQINDMDNTSQGQNSTFTASKPSALLSLPRELRDTILLYTILNDLSIFSLTTQRPACLFACRQLQDEYSDVLLNSKGLLKLDAYRGSWHEVTDHQSKRDIFLHCEFAVPLFASSNTPLGALEFMNGATRACKEMYREKGEQASMGIVTICTAKTAVKRWHWSLDSPRGWKSLG